jgi:hypothetical protein
MSRIVKLFYVYSIKKDHESKKDFIMLFNYLMCPYNIYIILINSLKNKLNVNM